MKIEELNSALEGFSQITPREDPAVIRGAYQLIQMLEAAKSGRPMDRARLQEAMTTSDFPNLFGNVMLRDLQAVYSEFPADWQSMSRRVDLPDFRNREWYPHDSMSQVLTKVGDDGGPATPNRSKTDPTAKTWKVDIYDGVTEVSWQTIRNDDLGFFSTIPQEFALAARRTELKAWTESHFNSTGPTGLTQLTSNPTLTVDNLKAVVGQMLRTTDAKGDPIMIQAPVLEVGPDLVVKASEIVAATDLKIDEAASATAIRSTKNWVREFITKVVLNPYIPIVVTTNEDTSWCLHANSASGPAAFEHGWLSGMVGPQVFAKASNMQRVGGGIESALGDFHTLSSQFKVLDVFGIKLVDSKLSFMSNGTGS